MATQTGVLKGGFIGLCNTTVLKGVLKKQGNKTGKNKWLRAGEEARLR